MHKCSIQNESHIAVIETTTKQPGKHLLNNQSNCYLAVRETAAQQAVSHPSTAADETATQQQERQPHSNQGNRYRSVNKTLLSSKRVSGIAV